MGKYFAKRLGMAILTIFLVACLTFLLMNAVPGSPWLSEKTPSETTLAALNAKYGLDKPVLEGYFIWLGKAVHGEFGESWIFHQPVKQKFASVIWYSFALALASFLLEIIIAIPLGIISATKQYSRIDYAVTVFALIGISLPSFFFATILKWIFSINLKWVDLYGIVSRMHESYGSVGKVLDMA